MIEPILIKAGGLPENRDEQDGILLEIRRAFLRQDFDRLQSFLSACHLQEEVILQNEEFYGRMVRMLERFIRIMPPLVESPLGVYMRFIAEDMVDCGGVSAAQSGNFLLQILEKPVERVHASSETVTPLPAAADPRPVRQETNDVYQLVNNLESDWHFQGMVGRALALTGEIHGLPEAERAEVMIRWLQDAGLLTELAADSLTDAARILVVSGHAEDALSLARNTERIFGRRPGLQSLLVDAALKAGELEDALHRLEKLAELGELTGNGQWLRAACLADLDRRDEALVILRAHLRETPEDADALQLLGVLERSANNLAVSVKALVRAWQLEPASALILRDLARSFHTACMPEQFDLALAELRRLDAEVADQLVLGVVVFLKSRLDDAICLIDGMGVGRCPQRIAGVKPGKHRLEWQIPDGTLQGIDVELQDGFWYKFRQEELGVVDEQSGRGGEITLYRPDGDGVKPVKLSEIMAEYRVESLGDLPRPEMKDILEV